MDYHIKKIWTESDDSETRHFICGETIDGSEIEHETVFASVHYAQRIATAIATQGKGIVDGRDWILISSPQPIPQPQPEIWHQPRPRPLKYYGIPECHFQSDLNGVLAQQYEPLDLTEYFPRMRHPSWQYLNSLGVRPRVPSTFALSELQRIIHFENELLAKYPRSS